MTREPYASERVAARIRERIDAGAFTVGDKLPPYRELASQHGISVNAAIAAVRRLRDLGYVTIRTNSGAFVRDRSVEIDVAAELSAIRDEVSAIRSGISEAGERLGGLEKRLTELDERQLRDA